MPKPPTAARGRQRVAEPRPPRPQQRRFGRWQKNTRATPAAAAAPVEDSGYHSIRPWLTTALCLFGLGVASYLTLAHYSTSVSLACPASTTINCEKVTTSPQSVVFGIPVAVLGLLYFVPMLALCVPPAWRSQMRWIAPARLAGAVTGIGFVCYLVYAELFQIHAICLWCTSVHVITFILFVTIVTGWEDALALRAEAAAA